jgi:hypothetical protein
MAAASSAAADARLVRRFTRTERALHWVLAVGFFARLASGLILYLPELSMLVARRPLIKTLHLYTGIAWLPALVLVFLVGNHTSLRATLRELDRFDEDDRRWLRHRPSRAASQRRTEAQRAGDRGLHRAVLGVGLSALVRRARHPLPLCRHDPAPRRLDVRLAAAACRAPLPGVHPPGDAPFAARDDDGLRSRRLGAAPPPEVGRLRSRSV